MVFGVRMWSTILRIFLGVCFRKYLRIQHSLVRQWIHVRRQSTRSYGSISHVFHVFDLPVVLQRQVHGQTVQVCCVGAALAFEVVADSLGLPQRFSSCCTLTKWSSWVVQVLLFSSADMEETADLPQLRRFAWTLALHMPFVVQRQVPYGR